MSDIETAALRLALFTLAFIAILIAVVRFRRPRTERTTPQMTLPSRRASPPVEEVEVAPSRLARVRTAPAVERLSEPVCASPPVVTPKPTPVPVSAPAPEPEPVPETVAAAIVPDAEEPAAHRLPAAVRLVPRMAPHGTAPSRSWLGGRPRLPAAMEWPKVDGRDGDFLAQIACADLPAGLWDGLGPRSGSILLFANSDSGAPMALHMEEDGPPRDPARAAGILWSGPEGELAALTHRAFPLWPVDVVPADTETPPARVAPDEAPVGYDVADPAFHPFDWDSILALATLLERRLARLLADPAPPADANDELSEAIAEAAETNREARLRATEIIAVIRDSAGEAPFSSDDAAAVMAGLRAIRWTSVTATPDPETGEDRVETLTLPLTRHHPGADWWVEDYRRLLLDHAKQAWCADPDCLPPAVRAFCEPLWRNIAAREAAASMGGRLSHPLPGFDDELDALLFVLPASALMNRARPGGRDMVVAIRKADLAIGDFSRLRLLGD